MATKTRTGDKFIETIGRRKTAIARARLTEAPRTTVIINGLDIAEYFDTEGLRMTALDPFLKVALTVQFMVTVVVSGGGIAGQAVAVRHAISRALVEYNHDLRTTLKKEGYLKRDPRAKERRKFGFKKARKRAQWSKR